MGSNIMTHQRNDFRRRFKPSFFCLATLICFLVSATLPMRGAATATPDFAFPKTVTKDASLQLRKALKEADYGKALQAAIQIDIAEALTSESSLQSSAQRFDSLAAVMPEPWNVLSLLAEARLFSDIYQSRPYVFDNRVLDPANPPDNILEWNRELFYDKVCSLVSRAFEASPETLGRPLAEVTAVLADYQDAVKNGFTIADFMTLSAVGSLSSFRRSAPETIPFVCADSRQNAAPAPSPTSEILKLLKAAVARHQDDKDKLTEAFFNEKLLNFIPDDRRKEFADSCLHRFEDTPYAVPFLTETLYPAGETPEESNKTRRKNYDKVKAYLSKFPDPYQGATLYSLLTQLENKSVSLTAKSKILPSKVDSITVEGSNIYDLYVLIYKVSPRSGTVKYSALEGCGAPMAVLPIHYDGTTPDTYRLQAALPALGPGRYAFVASSTKNLKGLLKTSLKETVQTFDVSDLQILTVTGKEKDTASLYVVSATDGRPLSGAKVRLTEVTNGKPGAVTELITDASGEVTVRDGVYDYTVAYATDFASGRLYSRYYSQTPRKRLQGEIFTDLAIFRPGDSVEFAAVTYTYEDKSMSVAAEQTVDILLRDANYQTVDSCRLTSDRTGRISGKFRLPDQGLLGNWQLVMQQGDNWICSRSFQVAEYKSPTFFVNLESASGSLKSQGEMTFSGKALTYSGMPVADARVRFTIGFSPSFRYPANPTASFGGEALTDAEGSFYITLDTSSVTQPRFLFGSYVLSVSVTDLVGETQTATPLRFFLRDSYTISPSIPERIEAAEDSRFTVSVSDAAGFPVSKTLFYRIISAGDTISSGSFESPNMILDTNTLPSGKYKAQFSIDPDFSSSEECALAETEFTVWRDSDTKPAVESVLWVDSQKIVVAPGEKSVRIRVGSSFPNSYVLAQVCDSKKSITSKWLKIDNGFTTLEIDSPEADSHLFVNLFAVHDFNTSTQTIEIVPYASTLTLMPEIVTFRDNVNPGAEESWKFRFSLGENAQAYIPVMAVMSDKSLNAITPFRWNFNPYSYIGWYPAVNLSPSSFWNIGNYFNIPGKNVKRTFPNFTAPVLQTYGYSLAASARRQRMMSRGVTNLMEAKVAYASAATADTAMVEESAMDSVAEAGVEMTMGAMTDADDAEGHAAEDAQLRPVEQPLAFFMPMLTTDKDGDVEIRFKAPDFIGSWQLQLLSYTPDMRGSVTVYDVKSVKKLMVRSNLPAFIRTGDKVSLSAQIFNNDADTLAVTGRIDVVNPLDGTVLQTFIGPQSDVAPSASCPVQTYWSVPANIDAVIVRVYGSAPGCTDGEQAVISVLPASTPVIDSRAFTLKRDAEVYRVKLPDFPADANVTLNYCDNPVWDCVAALPALCRPESPDLLRNLDSLFGNVTGSYLFNRYPAIKEFFERQSSPEAIADSMLVSPLTKNEQLKLVILDNTPWVNNAASESARMQSLVKFTDSTEVESAIESVCRLIESRQNADGGFGWCPGMNSSVFITSRVLQTLGALNNMKILPARLAAVASKASAFVQRQLAEEWVRGNRKVIPTLSLLDYLYAVKDMPSASASVDFRALEKKGLQQIAEDWRELDESRKAMAASVLFGKGNVRTARNILESLRQFESVSPLTLTAFGEIDPKNEYVDRIRDAIILSSQREALGERRDAAQTVFALLTTGSEWQTSRQMPRFYLDGSPLALPERSMNVGSYSVTLDPRKASGAQLEIRREAGLPAWGGVVSQYVAQLDEVKAQGSPSLSIRKEIIQVKTDDKGVSGALGLAVGDAIRVNLFVTNDEDLDYVVIKDGKGACVALDQQTSGYVTSDGIGFYRELRASEVNLYIPRLPKGSHVISYDGFIDRGGEYSSGIVSAQSLYSPVISAHSEAQALVVENDI